MSHSSVFPLEIQELRRPGSTYKVDVRWFTSVKDIKDQLQKETKCPASRMQLYHSVGSKGLPNKTTLHDLGITQPGGLLFLAFVYSSNPQFMLLPAKDVSVDEQCEEMMDEVRIGLRSGHLPAKTDMLDCTGGVYFMKGSANTPAAVFKPSDEEQGMPNNPKGYAGNGDYGLRPFFRPGEGCLREMASYILDHDHFCGVPATLLVHCEHDSFHYPRNSTGQKTMFPKLGSLQRFIPSGDTFEDIGHSLVGVLELQKIALLDMRLLNCDRNASNMLAIRKSPAARAAARVNGAPRKYSRSSSLASEGGSNCGGDEEISMEDFLDAEPQPQVSRYSDSYSLVPIDHGYCLPSHLRIDELDWAWFHCPHVAVEVQPEIRDYVNSLDIEALLQELTRQVAVPEDCLFLLRVAHAVIKEGIAAGLTLRDIAAIIARTDEDVPSPLENAIAAAEENALRAIEMRAGRRNTTSPSFLKSLQEASGGAVTPAGINLTELVVGVGGFSGKGGDSVLGSPAPVIVKQKSVGSPRSGGTASPPQRIGAVKRVSPPSPAMSPNEGEESDGYSINSTTGGSYQTKSTVQGAAVLKKTRSRSSDFDAEGELSDGSSFASPQARKPLYSGGAVPSAVVRPFPLRNTPPERQRRVVSSEVNLEAIGLAAASPPPAVAGGPPSASSLSSNSRSPIPPRSEKGLPVPARSATGAGAGETATIAYLSSENIQKLQSSPAMSASKLLFRDSLRALSGLPPPGLITPAGEATGRSGSPSNNELGDYFMKDLTLPPPASAPAGIAGTASEGLRLDPPPMFLCSSNSAASSPHHSRSNSAFTLLQPGVGSKDRIVATESGERLAATTINKPSSGTGLAHAYGSAQSVGSSGSGGSGGGAARPRPGDPLFTLQSFDEDYVRNRQRAAAASLAAQGVAVVGVDKATGAVSPAVPPQPPLLSLLPVVAGEGKSAAALAQTAQWPTVAVSPAQESKRPGSSAATEGQAAISASLFASDSDFTAHTSYESSWASESPKASPKVPFKERKTFPALEESAEEEGSGSSKKGTSERKINNINNAKVQVPVRDDARSSWREADSAEHAAGSLCDGPVHLVIPLKGEQDCGAGPAGDSSGRECSSSVELGGTDTEGDAEELGPQSQQRTHTMVHSAVKEPPNRALVSPDPGRATSWSLAPKLSRVASFAAFESPPLYDLPKTERQLTRLRQEKRKINATTAEYQQLRLTFAREMISALITKTSRSKAHL